MISLAKIKWQVMAASFALLVPALSAAQEELTWAEDVMPIFQEKCQDCHRPDSIAPMALLTYEQVRPFAPVIKYRVENRVMPPWHLNPDVGIQEFVEDTALSPEQRQTIIDWVDQGAPQGDMSRAPAPRVFNDALVWQLQEQMGSPPDMTL
ncbi:MAG: hypothetical protein RL120_13595, partial [Gammaproteobacteria bacterium]